MLAHQAHSIKRGGNKVAKTQRNKSSAMCNFTVRLDSELRDEIQQVSSSQKIPQSQVIRLAIQDGLSKVKIYNFDERQTDELAQAITELAKTQNEIISHEDHMVTGLNRVGNNINQIARRCNQTGTISDLDLEYVNKTITAFKTLRKEAIKSWQLLSTIRQQTEQKLWITSEETAKDTTDTQSEI